MDRPLLHEQAPVEYFKELVDAALARQHVEAGDLTAYYLVNLLCQYVRFDSRESADAPLALQLARALDRGGAEQRARLRSLGDFSLFMSTRAALAADSGGELGGRFHVVGRHRRAAAPCVEQ